jgi:amino acid adenylation domain-containing protein
LFSAARADALLGHVRQLLSTVLENPDVQVDAVSVIAEAERELLLVQRNAAIQTLPVGTLVHQLFEQQVARTPSKVALFCGEGRLTFGELNQRANQLARHLLSKGLLTGARVGICLERSLEMMIAILATLKAGGVYVPIDPAYPQDRQAFMIEDAEVDIVLTVTVTSSRLPKTRAQVVCIDQEQAELARLSGENLELPLASDALLYMIFTSGSTGRPKGSLVYHKGFVNLLLWYTQELKFDEQSNVLVYSSLSFDLTQKNLYATLITGGTLVLLDTPHYDAERILGLIRQHSVTLVNCTPSAFYGLLSNTSATSLARLDSLRWVVLGGESISTARMRAWIESPHFHATFVNSYGPTECTDVVAFHVVTDAKNYGAPIPIGRPVPNTRLYILDDHLRLVPDGAPGELCIGGICVGAGYVKRDELNLQKFVKNPFSTDPNDRIYRTGDRVRYLPDGSIDFLGRVDHQVKLRGYRIELGEVQSAIERCSEVRAAYVMARQDDRGEQALVAYVVLSQADSAQALASIRKQLATALPEYMVPTSFVLMDELPLTPNGKVDRSRLPAPQVQEVKKRVVVAKKSSADSPEERAQQLVAARWRDLLRIDDVGTTQRFFDIGGTSLKAVQFIGAMGQELNISIPMVALFQAPTVSEFVSYLQSNFAEAFAATFGHNDTTDAASSNPVESLELGAAQRSAICEIAIIGMSARVPGAKDLDAFWRMLREGIEGVRLLNDDELRRAGVDPANIADPNYVKAVAAMDDVEGFDANFFGMLRREVELMDPQHRAILEGAWTALEHAGYTSDQTELRIGVFAGVARDAYFTSNLLTHPNISAMAGDYSLMIGNEKDFPATRVAYRLDLRGPAVNIQTACSSSGVGIHLAAQNLALGECDIALAGGCRVLVPVAGYTYVEGGTLSPDGHVRAFDARGRGMIRGSGVCLVALKRLDRAQEDGDCIYGVIKSTAVNNDGNAKVGFAAPSVSGQSEVIRRAMNKANVHPESIQYVEAHGTATAIGDPIEVAALTDAYRKFTQKKSYCALGSVKTNIGHLDAGSCTAGLIKTVLAMRHGQIPPSLHYETPNPQIDFPNTPFFVNSSLREWTAEGGVRRAGVSSFGLGGTNVHLIVEEPAATKSEPGKGCEVLLLSAKTSTALQSMAQNLSTFLKANEAVNLADVAFTLQVGRKRFEHRRSIVARDVKEAIAEFESKENLAEGIALTSAPEPVFMFSGQGSQHVNMGKDLYVTEPAFRELVDEGCRAFEPHLGLDLRQIIYPASGAEAAATQRLNQTELAQPALFVMGYALAWLLIEWGVQPKALVGHSVGEFAAACLAGVLSLEDAAAVLSARARLMQSMPPGSMRAVRLPEQEVLALLTPGVALAACNTPSLCVVSGPHEAIKTFDESLAAKDLASVVLHTSHAFHSSMMDPILEPFGEAVGKVSLQRPQVPILSTATGQWLTDDECVARDYWVTQLRRPVRFSAAMTELARAENRVFFECGPNTTLTNSAKAHLAKSDVRRVINCLPHVNDQRSSRLVLHGALGRYFTLGGTVDWAKVRGRAMRRRVGLPPYPFERERFWVEPRGQKTTSAVAPPILETPTADAPGVNGVATSSTAAPVLSLPLAVEPSANDGVAGIVNRQLQLMSRQLGLLMAVRSQTVNPSAPLDTSIVVTSPQQATRHTPQADQSAAGPMQATTSAVANVAPAFVGPQSRISKVSNSTLTPKQRAYLDELIREYNHKTRASKEFAERHRQHLADPRVVSGFKPIIKELVYPIVVNRSLGAKLWDLDGNVYVDMLNGFGSNFFGHRAPFVVEALQRQLQEGIEIGPQHPLAGELAEELSAVVGHDRVAFCNTGSEAVLGAMRIARASTGRDLIAMFAGSYHGIFDEVIVRGTKGYRSLPAAPGIQPGAVANIVVLDYATDDTLRYLREHADSLAGILVEPVQSRRPDFQPREFLHELRGLTQKSGTCLIFDEVVTGFRAGLLGAQGHFDLKADIATYGKVLGGGMNIGVIAGRRQFMDALDGGAWRFGDESVPEVGVTYFAGTFVRHPPALVAAQAVLRYLKAQDGGFYERVRERTARLVDQINQHAKSINAPVRLSHFASVVRVEFTVDFPLSELLFVHLRHKGVHIWDHRPVYMTAAHTDEDVAQVVRAFRESLDAMRAGEVLPEVRE